MGGIWSKIDIPLQLPGNAPVRAAWRSQGPRARRWGSAPTLLLDMCTGNVGVHLPRGARATSVVVASATKPVLDVETRAALGPRGVPPAWAGGGLLWDPVLSPSLMLLVTLVLFLSQTQCSWPPAAGPLDQGQKRKNKKCVGLWQICGKA